jgi:predicted membrane protein
MRWDAMVYLLLAAILPPRPKSLAVLLATVLAVAVELLRLYHAPWLDDFRATAAGALLLGRVFSLWNILAYLVGIVAAWCCHRTGDIRP